ncbi:hypothetical protein V496_03303 [Pseudogymnoascus sp. VKM F-4515 (FW-2607)]|nr:hypothetical protein V496_03303 [Pseudogymnoascus sp. VKM F-4515 (FW-2607)]
MLENIFFPDETLGSILSSYDDDGYLLNAASVRVRNGGRCPPFGFWRYFLTAEAVTSDLQHQALPATSTQPVDW